MAARAKSNRLTTNALDSVPVSAFPTRAARASRGQQCELPHKGQTHFCSRASVSRLANGLARSTRLLILPLASLVGRELPSATLMVIHLQCHLEGLTPVRKRGMRSVCEWARACGRRARFDAMQLEPSRAGPNDFQLARGHLLTFDPYGNTTVRRNQQQNDNNNNNNSDNQSRDSPAGGRARSSGCGQDGRATPAAKVTDRRLGRTAALCAVARKSAIVTDPNRPSAAHPIERAKLERVAIERSVSGARAMRSLDSQIDLWAFPSGI